MAHEHDFPPIGAPVPASSSPVPTSIGPEPSTHGYTAEQLTLVATSTLLRFAERGDSSLIAAELDARGYRYDSATHRYLPSDTSAPSATVEESVTPPPSDGGREGSGTERERRLTYEEIHALATAPFTFTVMGRTMAGAGGGPMAGSTRYVSYGDGIHRAVRE